MAGKLLNPGDYDLPPRTCLEEIGINHYALVIDRKSRLIMADGRKILEKAGKLRDKLPGCRVSLRTTAPVCSKTISFLEKEGIDILA